jgi:type II secretory pathway pseudopilin PulG
MRIGDARERGFAYVLLLLAVALIGIAASASVSLGATIARRDAERQLLAVGIEFQRALRSYAGVLPDGAAPPSARGPRALEDLLKDPRVPGIKRHLRQLYADPLTGRAEWEVVRDADGFITGVFSGAAGEPIRRERFELGLASFEEAQSYRDWIFGLDTRPLAGSR